MEFLLTSKDYEELTKTVKSRLKIENSFDLYVPVSLMQEFQDLLDIKLNELNLDQNHQYAGIFNKENSNDDTVLVMFMSEQSYKTARTELSKLLQ